MEQVTEGKRVFSMSPQAPAPHLYSTYEESTNMQEKISKAALAEKLVVAMSDQAQCSIARYALALKTTLTGNPKVRIR